MQDINFFLTQQSKPATMAGLGNATNTKSVNALNIADGVNFFDLLLTKISSDPESTQTDALAFDLSGQGTTTQLDTEGLKKLQATLDSLLQGLPAEQRPVAIKLTPTQLQKIIQSAKAGPEEIQNAQQSLIATGLTPEQLSQLNDILQGNETDTEQNSDLQAILVGIIKLVPDDEKSASIFLPKTLLISKEEKPALKEEKLKGGHKDNELAGSLNALIVSENTPVSILGISLEENPDSADGSTRKSGGGFNEILKILEQIQNRSADGDVNFGKLIAERAASNASPQAAQASAGPINSTVAGDFDTALGSINSDDALNNLFPEGMDWSKGNNAFGLNNSHASSTAHLTSLVTQASSATQAHPATQIVMATLSRNVQTQEIKDITLRLDPPDLGKIQIQMQFTKDKSVKAHMIFERPETMLMMQRDSTLLQQALHDAGMDSGGNTLSFELSSQSNPFNDRSGGNGHSQGGRSSAPAEQQVIETTMNWSIDEETGIHHYNLLV